MREQFPPKTVKISNIKIDESIYPRKGFNKTTVMKYADSMRLGNIFPPIRLARSDGELILIDGRHRIEASRINKEKHIKAEIIEKTMTPKEMFLEAIKANIEHGQQLNSDDRKRVFGKLQVMNFTEEQIEKIIQLPFKKITHLYTAASFSDVSSKNKIIPPRQHSQLLREQQEYSKEIFNCHEICTKFLLMLQSEDLPKDDDFKDKLIKIESIIENKLAKWGGVNISGTAMRGLVGRGSVWQGNVRFIFSRHGLSRRACGGARRG